MKISVIIPALNEASNIAKCVRSAWQSGADQTIVSDGGSADDTVTVARREHATIVLGAPGRGQQQNAGAAEATGDLLVFLHADNWLAPGSLAQIRNAMHSPSVLHGAFRQRIEAPGVTFRCLELGNALRIRWAGLPYGDQGIFLRRETFENLGGFPNIPLMEDLALMRACRRQSWPRLLPGPVHVSARRWQHHGVVRQTLRNWKLLFAYQLGVAPDRLVASYRRHDKA